MGDLPNSLNAKSRILVSRNTPLAFVVGVAGFLGSHLAEALLKKGIQVVGVDNFSSGKKENLSELVKHKNFHLINETINDPQFLKLGLDLPRIDYAFFLGDDEDNEELNTNGILVFLNFIKETRSNLSKADKPPEDLHSKPRIVLTSSISLYGNKLDSRLKNQKEGEILFAKFVKHHKLNGRVVRLAALYGPRMHFRENDPVSRLIQLTLLDKIHDENTSLDFSSRNLFIDDAVNLVIKSVISGSTAHKIYDGSNIHPVKVSEIRQVLIDPLWYESRGFKPTPLPPWMTPNLERTVKELSWKPKTTLIEGLKKTVLYFKDNGIKVPEITEQEFEKTVKKWSFYAPVSETQPAVPMEDEADQVAEKENKPVKAEGKWTGKFGGLSNVKAKAVYAMVFLLILYGLIAPLGSLAIGILNIRSSVKATASAMEEGDFVKAQKYLESAQLNLYEARQIVGSFAILKQVNYVGRYIEDIDQILSVTDEGLSGISHATLGIQSLFKTTKIVSGEENTNPQDFYLSAQTELTTAGQKISKVRTLLDDEAFRQRYPEQIRVRMEDLSTKLKFYADVVEKGRSASFLLPQITAVDGKKSYLILLQNNMELRPTGGFIGSYAKLDFENGKIRNIKVDDVYNLDGGLRDIIEPPADIKNDLDQNRWYLRDSNYDPDFPSSARQAEFFYKRETGGEVVNGVIAMDLTASGKLLSAVGGVNLPDYGEFVDGSNLFEKVVTHAEVNFFPGSQAKKNYLTALQNQLFGNLFYLSNQNWPSIIRALGESLEQKHLLVYLADPQVFSYAVSENWAGVMPRGTEDVEGETKDFLAVVESNMGANKSNYYLERSKALTTTIGKEGQVYHKLQINYKNNSPSEVFPAGKYKNRLRIYLPLGTKLNKLSFGNEDLTANVTSFSDYGRTVYSILLQVMPKEQKELVIEYSLPKSISFIADPTDPSGKIGDYRLDIIKQPGTEKDRFDWKLTYPIHYRTKIIDEPASISNQEVNISTDLLKDRSFILKFTQK